MHILAKINSSNIVEEILDLDQSCQNLSEQELIDKLNLSGNWKLGDTEALFGNGFRKNCPQIRFSFDAARDAFVWPKRYQSWTLNEDTCDWNPPTPRPDGHNHFWSEDLKSWQEST